MSIWFWMLSFFLGFCLGFLTAACMACESRADAEIERAVAGEVKRRADDDTRPMVEIVDDFTIRDWAGKEVKHGKQ